MSRQERGTKGVRLIVDDFLEIRYDDSTRRKR
jgi:hypothetical protein